MGNAMLGIRGMHAGYIHEVRYDRTAGRFRARTRAIIQGRADRIAFHHHRVHHTLDIGDQPPRGNERGMNAQFDPRLACAG